MGRAVRGCGRHKMKWSPRPAPTTALTVALEYQYWFNSAFWRVRRERAWTHSAAAWRTSFVRRRNRFGFSGLKEVMAGGVGANWGPETTII